MVHGMREGRLCGRGRRL